jgi:GBP family porin
MKHLLLALLVSAGATTAFAQSNVTIYGLVDVSMSSVTEGKGTGANTVMSENSLNTSRLGFKGTEDLGGGLKAEFQLESRLNPSTGSAGIATSSPILFNREAWVGLSSATLGSIRMGRSDITGAQVIDSKVGQVGNFSDADGNLGTDVAKVVRYTTPTFAGFSAQVGWSNPDATETTNTTDGSMTSAYVQYEAGKFGVYAGQVDKKINATYKQKEITLGAKYDFGFATVGAYRSVRTAATSALATSNGDFTQTVFSVSAPVKALGKGISAHGAYFKNQHDVADKSGNVDGYKLALIKAFSKRTDVYVAYANQSTNNTTDKDNIKYIVGLSHAF